MTITQKDNPAFNPELTTAAIQKNARLLKLKEESDEDLALRMQKIITRAPNLPVSSFLPLSKTNISNQALDGLAAAATLKNAEEVEPKTNEPFLSKYVTKPLRTAYNESFYDPLKWTSRNLTAIGDLGTDVLNNLVFGSIRKAKGLDQQEVGFFEATRGGQFFEQFQYQGEGFFQSERQRLIAELGAKAYRGTYDFSGTGKQEALTIGKVDAEILTPDFVFNFLQKAGKAIQGKNPNLIPTNEFSGSSELGNKTGPYTFQKNIAANAWDLAAESAISGLIDAAINVTFDPTLVGGKLTKGLKLIRKGMKALEGAEDVVEVSKIAKAAQLEQASLDFVGTLNNPMNGVILTPNGLRAAYRAGKAIDKIPDAEATFNAIKNTRNKFNTQRDILEKEIWQDMTAAGASPQEISAELSRRVSNLEDLRNADELKIWDESAVTSFVKRDKRVRDFFDVVVDVEQGPALSYRLRHFIFRDRINIEQSSDIAEILTKNLTREQKISEIEQYFFGMTQRLKQSSTPGLFPTDITDLTKKGIYSRFVQKDMPVGGLETGISHGKLRRYLGDAPNSTPIAIDGSAAQRAASVHNFKVLLSTDPNLTQRQIYEQLDGFEKALTKKQIKLEIGSPNEVTGLRNEIQMLGGAIGKGGTPTAIKSVYGYIETFMERLLVQYGFNQQQIKESLAVLRKDYEAKAQYAIDNMGRATDFGLFEEMLNNPAIISKESRDEILQEASKIAGRPVTTADLRALGPSVNVELLNHSIMMPDLEAIRQLTASKAYSKTFYKKLERRNLIKTKGNLRFPFRFTDSVVNEIWKPITLMNPAYVFRNVLEGQARLMFLRRDGVAGVFSNPARYLAALSGRIAPEDLAGNVFTLDQVSELATKAVDELTDAEAIFLDATNASRWSQIPSQNGPRSTLQEMVQTNEWLSASKENFDERFNYINGILDQMRLINLDPLQKLWSHLSELPDDASKVDEAMKWLNSGTDVANKTKVQLISRYENGIEFGFKENLVESAGREFRLPAKELNRTQQDAILRAVLSKAIEGRVSRFDEIPELRAFMAQNVIPIIDDTTGRALIENIPIKANYLDFESEDVIRFGLRGKTEVKPKESLPSALIKGPDGSDYNYFVLSVRTGKRSVDDSLQVIRVRTGDRVAWSKAGDELNYDDLAKETVTKMLEKDIVEKTQIFPQNVGYAVRKPLDEKTMADSWKTFISAVFNSPRLGDGLPWLNKLGFVGRIPSIQSSVTLLEKLPTYRQLLWTTITENLDLLDPKEIENLVQLVRQRAKFFKMTPNEYMGGSRFKIGITNPGDRFDLLQKKVNEVLASEKPGTGTMLELNTYAHAKAKNEMQNLFFDSGQKKGFDTGVLNRLNFQFAVAQRTIVMDAMRLFANAPLETYKIEKGFKGATQVDFNPYDQRPGFFYKNPQDGKYYFKVPFADSSIRLASAINLIPDIPGSVRPYLGAPVAGINMGFNFFPALGPVGQIGYTFFNKILPLSPEDKEPLKNFFLPYGEKPLNDILLSFVPGWLRKGYSGFLQDSNDMKNLIAQNKADVGMALLSSGEYSMETAEEANKLDADATKIARFLTIMQSFNQLIGPSTGQPNFEIQTKNGDFISVELFAKELRKLQERQTENGYETAIADIIELYGEAVGPYVAGKTRTGEDYSGLEATKEFFFWQQQNQRFFNNNKAVAGYFAPKGSDWFWGAYSAQLKNGQRERLALPEIYNAYTYAIGASYYRKARVLFPAVLNDQQEESLRNYRKLLHLEYPGYPEVPRFQTDEFDTLIVNLKKAIKDPAVANLDVTKAMKDYLELRDFSIQLAENNNLPGLRSIGGKPRRAALAQYGRMLSQQYPEFARIWERELSSEVVLAGE